MHRVPLDLTLHAGATPDCRPDSPPGLRLAKERQCPKVSKKFSIVVNQSLTSCCSVTVCKAA